MTPGSPRLPFDIITFDCYGTLVDWQSGISAAFNREAQADGLEFSTSRILDAYARIEPLVQAEAFRPYRDVLGQVAQRVARALGWAIDPSRAEFLARSLASWPVFADTDPALERLVSQGYSLGILSNVDDDLLQATLRHLEVDFSLQVTATRTRSYKPAAPHFEVAQQRIGSGRWLHAAQSYFHDVEPAWERGLAVAWINRKGEPAGGRACPDHEFENLRLLADWLAG